MYIIKLRNDDGVLSRIVIVDSNQETYEIMNLLEWMKKGCPFNRNEIFKGKHSAGRTQLINVHLSHLTQL